MAEANFRHYEPRCAHGSSLSAGMHARVAARLGDAEMALRYLRETAATDLDLDPNSAGGVRIAGLGALWQAVMLGFAGLDLMGDALGIHPRLAAPMAEPDVPRVLERPIRGYSDYRQDNRSNIVDRRCNGDADCSGDPSIAPWCGAAGQRVTYWTISIQINTCSVEMSI